MKNIVNSYLNNTELCTQYYTPIQLELPLDLETRNETTFTTGLVNTTPIFISIKR